MAIFGRPLCIHNKNCVHFEIGSLGFIMILTSEVGSIINDRSIDCSIRVFFCSIRVHIDCSIRVFDSSIFSVFDSSIRVFCCNSNCSMLSTEIKLSGLCGNVSISSESYYNIANNLEG